MHDALHEKNGTLQVERGGQYPFRGRRKRGRRPGPRVLCEPERELERELRDAFVVIKGADGNTPSRGIAAICCGDAMPWRALGLRCLEALWAGAPSDRILAVAERFLTWVRRQVAARDNGNMPRDRAA
jgi:hypothetical protein